MSQILDGIDDVINWLLIDLPGAWTVGQVVKFDAGVTWQSMFSNDNSSNASRIATGRQGIAGTFSTFTGGGANTQQGPTTSSADGWVALFAGRSAGLAQTIRFMKYPIGGSPAFSTSSGGQDDQTSQAGGKTVFGEIDGADFYKGKFAVGGIWTSKLSDADMQSCIDTFTLANWLSKTPGAMWDARDVFATDLTGNGHDRTLLTGTSASADDPAGWATWAASSSIWLPTYQPAHPMLIRRTRQGPPLLAPFTGADTPPSALEILASPASLTLSAAAPTPAASAQPAAGLVTLSAPAPTAAENAQATAGLLNLSAAAPVAAENVTHTAALLTLGAAAPALLANVTPTSAGLITLSAAAPVIGGQLQILPPPATMTLSAAAPTVVENVPATAALVTLGAAAPSVSVNAQTTPGTLTLSSGVPKVALSATPVGTLTLSGAAPALRGTVQPVTAALLTLSAAAPAVIVGVIVTVTAPFDQPSPGGRSGSSPSTAAFDQPEPVGEPG